MRKNPTLSLLLIVLVTVSLCVPIFAAGTDTTVTIGGKSYDASAASITVTNPDVQELTRKLPRFSQLQTVSLDGNLPARESLLALKEAFPGVCFAWEFSLCGVQVHTQAEFVDLSGIPLEDTSELVAALPLFHNLKQVDMVDCGISNEDMEALNRSHPGTRFVWTVQLRGIKLRTDATAFMPTKEGYRVDSTDCQLLRYCHDLEFIDLGHMPVNDCSFLYETPNVKCLILADTGVSDAAPIGSLMKLEFLELFMSKITDYAPLANCTSLKDLNLCFTNAYNQNALLQLQQLDRLWLAGGTLSSQDIEALQQALPQTMVCCYSKSSTNHGWRYSPHYYLQRDAYGMPYSYS